MIPRQPTNSASSNPRSCYRTPQRARLVRAAHSGYPAKSHSANLRSQNPQIGSALVLGEPDLPALGVPYDDGQLGLEPPLRPPKCYLLGATCFEIAVLTGM